MQSAKAAALLCLVVASGIGTWYLQVSVPDKEWQHAEEAGRQSLGEQRFAEAERYFALAVHTARSFGDPDPRLGRSLFHLAQALVGQSKDAEALPFLEQSAMIQSKALGTGHPDVSRVLAYQTVVLNKLARLRDRDGAGRTRELISNPVIP
jgi:hypothetical protein